MSRKQLKFSAFTDSLEKELYDEEIQDLENQISIATAYNENDLRQLYEAITSKDAIRRDSQEIIYNSSSATLQSLKEAFDKAIALRLDTIKNESDSETINKIVDSMPFSKSKLVAQIEIAENNYNTRLREYNEALKLSSGARVTITKEQLDVALKDLNTLKINLLKSYPDQPKPIESKTKAEVQNTVKNKVNFPIGIAACALVCIVAISLID